MAQTYSLAAYAISINTRGDRNDRQVLSDFNNGQDFLNYVETMMNGWKRENANNNVPVNCDGDDKEGSAFRLSCTANGSYNLFLRGRYLSGILETGEYGTQEDGVDITTGEVSFRKKAKEALMKPFYFMFYIPKESKVGFLLVEKISNYGILTLLSNAIAKYFETTPSDYRFVLKIAPLSIDQLVAKKMYSMRYEAKKVEMRKVRNEDLRLSRLSGNTIDDKGVSTTIVYTAQRNAVINIAKFIEKLRKKQKKDTSFYEVDDKILCDDIAVTIEVDGQKKVLSLQNIQTLGMTMDITNDIVLGANRYPTYDSVHQQANQLISYIKEQFK